MVKIILIFISDFGSGIFMACVMNFGGKARRKEATRKTKKYVGRQY
jgi:hypothetical protein